MSSAVCTHNYSSCAHAHIDVGFGIHVPPGTNPRPAADEEPPRTCAPPGDISAARAAVEDRNVERKVMQTEAQSLTHRDCLLQEVEQGVVF